MPVLQDRVQETTTTGGTGTIALAGAVTGYRSFNAAFTIGDVTYYTIDDGAGAWEIGVGTVGSGTLSRDSVLESSNANALVNFSAGTKRVFCSAPTKVLLPDQTSNSGKVLTTNGTDPSWTTTLNGITLGNITPGSGAFTTLSASSTVSGTGFSTYLASPPAIGGTTPAAGNFTTLGATGNTTLGDAAGDTLTINAGTTTFTQGTANGVLYLNGSNVATSGSALTFDGTNLGVGGTSGYETANRTTIAAAGVNSALLGFKVGSTSAGYAFADASHVEFGAPTGRYLSWDINGERMRLTSKGLLVGYTSDASLSGTGNAIFSGNVGIGTSSPGEKLQVNGTILVSGEGRVRVKKDGSDTIGVGPFYEWQNAAGSRSWFTQLGASNSLDWWHYNGSSYTKQATLDSSGNLGLGVTPSAWGASRAIQVGNASFWGAPASPTFSSVGANYYYDGANYRYINSAQSSDYYQFNGAHVWRTAPSGTAGAAITFTQPMTLDASGNLGVGETNPQAKIHATGGTVGFLRSSTSGSNFISSFSSGSSGDAYYANVYGTGQYILRCEYQGGSLGGITTNGTTINYGGTSDQRLKTNITPAGSAIQSILDFPVDQFDWISTGEHQDFGAVAQKAINVIPEMVIAPTNPEDMWAVDWSKAVPRLIRAYQELHAEIETLKQKVNA